MVSIATNDRRDFLTYIDCKKGNTSSDCTKNLSPAELKTSTAPTRGAFMQIVQKIEKINGHMVTIIADVPLQGGALEQVKRDRSCRLCQAEWESGPEAEGSWSDM